MPYTSCDSSSSFQIRFRLLQLIVDLESVCRGIRRKKIDACVSFSGLIRDFDFDFDLELGRTKFNYEANPTTTSH